MVKDLVTENVDGGSIYFCEATTNIVRQDKSAKVVCIPVVSIKIGDHCYYGLFGMGASASAIPYTLYQEIMREIAPCELEDIGILNWLIEMSSTQWELSETLKSYVVR